MRVEKRISIARSPQEVFDYASDPANDGAWISGSEASEWITDPPHGVGSRQRNVQRFLGRRLESESEITAWDPPTGFSARFSKPFPGEFTARLSAQGEGTEVELTGEMEVGGFFRIAEGLVARQLDRTLDADLNALKLILESE